MKIFSLILTIALLGCLSFSSPSLEAFERQKLDNRRYSISKPYSRPANGYRLLLFLHGQGGNEHQADRLLGEYGPEHGYIVLGPAATKDTWGSSGADPKFVHKLIRKIQEEYDIPREKTILVGHSAGGMASYFYVLPYPETIGAFCSVNGFMPTVFLPQLVRSTKMNLLLINGENDYNLKTISGGSKYLRNQGYLVHQAIVKDAGHGYLKDKYNSIIINWFEGRIAAAEASAAEESEEKALLNSNGDSKISEF